MRKIPRRRPGCRVELARTDPGRQGRGTPVDAAAEVDGEVVCELGEEGLDGAQGPVYPVHRGGGRADDVGGDEGELPVLAGVAGVYESWDHRVLYEDLLALVSCRCLISLWERNLRCRRRSSHMSRRSRCGRIPSHG